MTRRIRTNRSRSLEDFLMSYRRNWLLTAGGRITPSEDDHALVMRIVSRANTDGLSLRATPDPGFKPFRHVQLCDGHPVRTGSSSMSQDLICFSPRRGFCRGSRELSEKCEMRAPCFLSASRSLIASWSQMSPLLRNETGPFSRLKPPPARRDFVESRTSRSEDHGFCRIRPS
jgi:hypothetical protein